MENTPLSISTPADQSWLEVIDFLKSIKLEQYIDVFEAEGFDRMEALCELTAVDLTEMNIKRGHAKILLRHTAKWNPVSPSKKVRFGANGSTLRIVQETQDHSPNTDMHPDDILLMHHVGASGNLSGSSGHGNLRHNLSAPGKESPYSSQTHLSLARSVSARSDDSCDDNLMRKQSSRSVRSYTEHSIAHSIAFSDAGTVVMRPSVFDGNDLGLASQPTFEHDASFARSTPSSPALPVSSVSSPNAMPPLMMDMHSNLQQLVTALEHAKCQNNPNYDEYHEALVNVTAHWEHGQSEKTLKYLDAQANGNNYVVLDLLGVLCAQIGRTDEAISYHHAAIEKSNHKYIEAMHNFAYLLHHIGDKTQFLHSKQWYKTALSINDKFAHCWLHYGNLLEDEGDMKEAMRMYLKAIAIRPRNAAFHLDLANVLDDVHDFHGAAQHYEKCIELQPNDAVYHWNYAISLENQSHFARAEEAYKRAIRLDYQCVDAHINYAHMLENQPCPQYEKALQQYELILKMPEMDNNPEIMLKCGKLHEYFSEFAKCESVYMSVIQMDPTFEDAYILFAAYLTNQNRIEDANACYQAGLRQVQSPKLQEHYIQFLKDINSVYNHSRAKASTTNTRSGIKQTLNSLDTGSNDSGSGHSADSANALNGKSYVPQTPFISSSTKGAPQQFPSASDQRKVIKVRGNPKTTAAAGSTPEEGCIVM
eukprot:CAMPEP_0202728686 /NCGR_PEP_ID=MMETSP1385-20130828/185752_1 /ASSEMBLY_ACC=CAM_ASM_000861 /TAXON_ID=933848 /ORGANISM="Elphidium margaritaceum" /LENGTH=704 /DNA_ID=CAMNT_0049394937 /DNA_START=30 /DNA_END=2144 /DNA_ORIENTATION=-